jgi:monovalent cation:H+ antiporter-2, CPA2 family
MSHLPSLIYDLALILISAGVTTILFKWLKQPLVLGYIVAGILAGPYVTLLPLHLKDTANIQTWAEIGVIFLLFALGLEFSFKKLVSVGKTAFLTATVIVVGMMSLGMMVGSLMGWSAMNSIFLGGMLAMSSTTIIFKAFTDKGVFKEPYVKQVFGVLIVEDLFAVILMVLLSTISVSKNFDGGELIMSISRLIFFLVLWFIFGIFLIPTFLKRFRRLMSEETLLIVSAGLCLTMVVVAVETGFSAALGAFIMGSILAETNDVKRIEKLMDPVKNLFGAIFFVSVGMMVQPLLIAQYAVPILILVVTVVVGQLLFSTVGYLLSGSSLKTAMQSGFSLGQLGEFAFIIASLGVSLGVTDSFLYPVVIAVSVITIFLTPYVMDLAVPAYNYLSVKLPDDWMHKIIQPRPEKEKTVSQKAWGQLIQDFLVYTVVLTTVVLFILILSTTYVKPLLTHQMSSHWANATTFLATLLLISPFLRAMMNINGKTSSAVLNLSLEKASNKRILHILTFLRAATALILMMYLTSSCFEIPWYVNAGITLLLLILIVRSKWLQRNFWRMESRFLINLNERKMEENLRRIEANKGVMQLSEMHSNHWLDYKLFTCAMRLRPESPLVGQRIRELKCRNDYNVMVIRIRTKEMSYINIPSGEYVLQEGDTLRLAGKRSSLKRMQEVEFLTFEFVDHSFMTLHGFSKLEFERKEQKERILCSGLPLHKSSPLNGKTLVESKLGAQAKCLVVGLERNNKQIVNPEADTILSEGDVLWVVGEEKPVSRLIQANVYGV